MSNPNTKEIWLPIRKDRFRKSNELHKYEVSNLGNVRHKKNKNNLRLQSSQVKDYKQLKFGSENFYVHRLVGRTFHDPPEGGIIVWNEIDHIDHNPANNRAENLKYATKTTNMQNRNFSDKSDKREPVQNLSMKNMPGEIWKNLAAPYENYQISNKGRVKKTEILHQFYLDKYRAVTFKSSSGIEFNRRVHKIVADYFIDNPNKYDIVLFKNGDPDDVRVENLKFGTQKDVADVTHQRNKGNIKPIKRLANKNYDEITFKSIADASRYMKINTDKLKNTKEDSIRLNIIKNASGKSNTAYGFKWVYVDKRKP